VFTIKGLEQGWVAQCQFNVTGWGVNLWHGTSVCIWLLQSISFFLNLTSCTIYW